MVLAAPVGGGHPKHTDDRQGSRVGAHAFRCSRIRALSTERQARYAVSQPANFTALAEHCLRFARRSIPSDDRDR